MKYLPKNDMSRLRCSPVELSGESSGEKFAMVIWTLYTDMTMGHLRDQIWYFKVSKKLQPALILHPHFLIRVLAPSAFSHPRFIVHPHFLIRVLAPSAFSHPRFGPSAFSHPRFILHPHFLIRILFSIRNFSSAFWLHPHFLIRVLSSIFIFSSAFYSPSAFSHPRFILHPRFPLVFSHPHP